MAFLAIEYVLMREGLRTSSRDISDEVWDGVRGRGKIICRWSRWSIYLLTWRWLLHIRYPVVGGNAKIVVVKSMLKMQSSRIRETKGGVKIGGSLFVKVRINNPWLSVSAFYLRYE